MRAACVTLVAGSWWLCGPAVAQKADVELGVLTCTLEAPSKAAESGPVSESQLRGALCTFKPKQGSEEAYDRSVEGMSLSPDARTTAIWVVKADGVLPSVPGLLQQTYALDRNAPTDQLPPLIGQMNERIVLQSMADKEEGAASATEKRPPTGYVITALQLKLKSASG